MENKVVLVLVDGMRSEALLNCGHPYVPELIARSAHALDARTVMPSVTLPCHMSLFHSVDPDRHGILTNDYVPQVRPIVGLFDQLDTFGKKNGFFYTWEQLRDLCRPGHLHTALFINQGQQTDTDRKITDAAMKFIAAEDPDFTFIYLGETDEVGHAHGWMGPEYMGAVHNAVDCRSSGSRNKLFADRRHVHGCRGRDEHKKDQSREYFFHYYQFLGFYRFLKGLFAPI